MNSTAATATSTDTDTAEATRYVAAVANAADVVGPAGFCDVTVLTSEVSAYRDGDDGTPTVPVYALTGTQAMDTVVTGVPVAGDQDGLQEEAEAILAAHGWRVTGPWEGSDNAYYAVVQAA